MIGAIIGYVVARPFIRKAFATRRKLSTERRIAHHASQDAQRRAKAAPRPTFTAEERAYLAAHAVSPYRRDK